MTLAIFMTVCCILESNKQPHACIRLMHSWEEISTRETDTKYMALSASLNTVGRPFRAFFMNSSRPLETVLDMEDREHYAE